MKIIALIGMAGSGKSTIGEVLAERLGYHHISTGDLARKYINGSWNELGLPAPEDRVRYLVINEVMQAEKDGYEGIVVDGMPRKPSQVVFLKTIVGRNGSLSFINLIIERTLCKERLIARGRGDDMLEAIDNRHDTFEQNIIGITKAINKHKLPLFAVNANQAIEDIVAEISEEAI